VTSNPSRIGAIYLQPVGEGVDGGLLRWLAGSLDDIFGVPCYPNGNPLAVQFAFDAARGQYHSTAILQRLQPYAAGLEEIRLLGVTVVDLFVPVLTFVFGEAQLEGRCAVVSLHRLHEEFYGLPPDSRLLEERALKEAVHELGHTFGLKHCPDWRCVMASTHAVERLDLKGANFCPSCRKLVWPG
jgi:archaemetzincin